MSTKEKWVHLDSYEQKAFRKIIQAYDEIMDRTDDIHIIARKYHLNPDDIQRAKDYAFGSGVSKYKFTPDIDMVQAWQRIALREENDIDKVLLKHEVYESDLVINQGMNQIDAHNLTQEIYPWSILLKERNQKQ
jgi:hypothetical protein